MAGNPWNGTVHYVHIYRYIQIYISITVYQMKYLLFCSCDRQDESNKRCTWRAYNYTFRRIINTVQYQIICTYAYHIPRVYSETPINLVLRKPLFLKAASLEAMGLQYIISFCFESQLWSWCATVPWLQTIATVGDRHGKLSSVSSVDLNTSTVEGLCTNNKVLTNSSYGRSRVPLPRQMQGTFFLEE